MGKTGFRMMCAAAAIGFLSPAFATEQVYHPISPALGGNPNNGSFLLSTAQAQGEGVNSGNQGPNLTGLTNALSGIGSPTSQSNGAVANPTQNAARMP